MKRNIKLSLILILLLPFFASAQSWILYRADKWADLSNNKSWTTAMDNPIRENVGVYINDAEVKFIKAKKITTFKILKKIDKPNQKSMEFKVSNDGKIYDLKVYEIYNSTFFKMEGLWMIEFDNRNRKLID